MGEGREIPGAFAGLHQRKFGALGVLLLGVSLWACSDGSPFAPQGTKTFGIVPEMSVIGPGETIQLKFAGLAGAQAQVKWLADPEYVASVDGRGVVSGKGPGTAWIKARVGDFADSVIVEVRGGAGIASVLRPNEPSGFTPLGEHDFSCRPGEGCARIGDWSESPESFHQSNLSIVERTDSPVSGPWVARTRFPKGLRSGVGPVSFGWASNREFRALYISKWIRIAGSDYENHPALTKMGWIGFGQSYGDAQGTLGLQSTPSTGRVQIVTELQPTFRQQGHTGGGVWGSGMMDVGEWHQWEILFELNDRGRSNGVMKWWIDGELILSRDDMVFITSGNEKGFFSYRWNPTWGGAGDFVRTRDDFMEIDHVYISGVPK